MSTAIFMKGKLYSIQQAYGKVEEKFQIDMATIYLDLFVQK